MNGQHKKLFSFNIIDVALVVIALICICTTVFFFTNADITNPKGAEKVTLEYTIEFTPIREEFRNLLEIGDSITETSTMSDAGEIINVIYLDHLYYGTNDETGETVTTKYPGKINMTLTVRAEAIKTDTGYSINGYELLIGDSITIRTPSFTGTGVCTSITIPEESI